MPIPRALLASAFAVATLQTANAATLITENLTGTVTGANTTDTLGLFGPARASLSGKALAIHLQYVPDYLPTKGKCRATLCTYNYSNASPNLPGSIQITITINGRQAVYAPTTYGEALFNNHSSNLFYLYSDTTSFGLGLRGVEVEAGFSAPVVFGEPLSPANPPTLNSSTDFISFFTPASGQLPGETLSFAVRSATN